MEKVNTIKFEDNELKLLNNVLMDHCLAMVELINTQKDQESYEKVIKILQASVSAQHYLFSSALEKNVDHPESICLLYRSLVEHAIETLNEIKKKLTEAGDLNFGGISENCELLKNILAKIPEKSLIALS